MRLRIESGIGIGGLLALQLATTGGAIGLLARTAPAVERILRENVYSGEAVEDMLSVLAAPGEEPARTGRFYAALERAQSNVSEPQEPPLLRAVEQRAESALAGDEAAREAVVGALRDLGVVNRNSMAREDQTARSLSATGAWAAAVMGLVSFLVGVLVYRRLRLRLELPVVEVDGTLAAVRVGDAHRRCSIADAPAELQRVGDNVNWLIDRLHAPVVAAIDTSPPLRAAMLHLVDRIPTPAALVDMRGDAVALNRACLEAAGGEGAPLLGPAMSSAAAGAPMPEGWTAEKVRDTGWWLVVAEA